MKENHATSHEPHAGAATLQAEAVPKERTNKTINKTICCRIFRGQILASGRYK
jgi:hypothetical protein